MKRLCLVLGTSIVILLWPAGAKVQADLIQWSASANVVGAGGYHGVTSTPSPSGPNFIEINMGYTPTINGTNTENIVLVNLGADVAGNWLGVDNKFSGPSAQYQLSLLLRDQASGDSGTLTFNGYFSGTLGIGYPQPSLTNTFVGPTTQTLSLGHNLYTVTLGPVVLPESTNSYPDFPNADSGSISASIAVQPSINSTPEPSSLVLASLALSSLGLASWRRRRQRRRAIVYIDASKA